MTTHNKRARFYITMEFLKGGANLAIYTLLMCIEEEYLANGRLQRIIYWLVDGGSENTNYTLLAIIELLIVMDIGVEEIWLIRMPKGHNHADQDGKFALIWVKTRDMSIMSPHGYTSAIHR